MPCGKLNTLTGLLPVTTPTSSVFGETRQAAGPTHSLQSYQTQQPGWSQYDRKRKDGGGAGPPRVSDLAQAANTVHGASYTTPSTPTPSPAYNPTHISKLAPT